MVVCTGFRNPALTAKLSSTIDVISGGRFELGIGAGWKEEEWRAYGYGFPTLGERMARLRRPPRGHHARCSQPGPGDVRGRVRPRPRRDQRAAGPPGAAHPDHRRRQRPAADRRLRDPVRATSSTSCSSSADEIAARMRRRPRALRGRGPRSGDAAVLALRRATSRCATPARRGSIVLGAVRRDRPRPAGRFPTRWSPTLEAQAAFAEDCRAAGSDARTRGPSRRPV